MKAPGTVKMTVDATRLDRFKVGDRVESTMTSAADLGRGSVIKVHENGLYDILWDDYRNTGRTRGQHQAHNLKRVAVTTFPPNRERLKAIASGLFAPTPDESAWLARHNEPIFTAEEQAAIATDNVNHPSHYTRFPGVEVIQITEHLDFCRGNAVKYIARAGAKDSAKEIEDLEKAKWYLERSIALLKRTVK